MEATIELSCLQKRFGQTVALDRPPFSVTPGNTGLVGPNGAGEPASMRAFLGRTAANARGATRRTAY
jgi:ABC-type multidrug transport system ATPase subunit